jgi:hypothetical protein
LGCFTALLVVLGTPVFWIIAIALVEFGGNGLLYELMMGVTLFGGLTLALFVRTVVGMVIQARFTGRPLGRRERWPVPFRPLPPSSRMPMCSVRTSAPSSSPASPEGVGTHQRCGLLPCRGDLGEQRLRGPHAAGVRADRVER